MNWNRNTTKDGNYDKPIDQAFQIFENWAEEHQRNYFSDLILENLQRFLDEGCTPQEASDRLTRK